MFYSNKPSQSERRLSGPAWMLVTPLVDAQQGAVWTVDDAARLIEIFKKRIRIYLLIYFYPR